jgi:hypothetical protein
MQEAPSPNNPVGKSQEKLERIASKNPQRTKAMTFKDWLQEQEEAAIAALAAVDDDNDTEASELLNEIAIYQEMLISAGFNGR